MNNNRNKKKAMDLFVNAVDALALDDFETALERLTMGLNAADAEPVRHLLLAYRALAFMGVAKQTGQTTLLKSALADARQCRHLMPPWKLGYLCAGAALETLFAESNSAEVSLLLEALASYVHGCSAVEPGFCGILQKEVGRVLDLVLELKGGLKNEAAVVGGSILVMQGLYLLVQTALVLESRGAATITRVVIIKSVADFRQEVQLRAVRENHGAQVGATLRNSEEVLLVQGDCVETVNGRQVGDDLLENILDEIDCAELPVILGFSRGSAQPWDAGSLVRSNSVNSQVLERDLKTLLIQGAQPWWVNGEYVPQEDKNGHSVYENAHGCLVSFEKAGNEEGWVLGRPPRVLYATKGDLLCGKGKGKTKFFCVAQEAEVCLEVEMEYRDLPDLALLNGNLAQAKESQTFGVSDFNKVNLTPWTSLEELLAIKGYAVRMLESREFLRALQCLNILVELATSLKNAVQLVDKTNEYDRVLLMGLYSRARVLRELKMSEEEIMRDVMECERLDKNWAKPWELVVKTSNVEVKLEKESTRADPEFEKFDRTPSVDILPAQTDQDLDKIRELSLKEGFSAFKHGRRGQPKLRHFMVNADLSSLLWQSSKSKSNRNFLRRTSSSNKSEQGGVVKAKKVASGGCVHRIDLVDVLKGDAPGGSGSKSQSKQKKTFLSLLRSDGLLVLEFQSETERDDIFELLCWWKTL